MLANLNQPFVHLLVLTIKCLSLIMTGVGARGCAYKDSLHVPGSSDRATHLCIQRHRSIYNEDHPDVTKRDGGTSAVSQSREHTAGPGVTSCYPASAN